MTRSPPSVPPGFTLLELLVTVVILLVVLVAGVPALSALVAQNRMTATVNSFVAIITLTRSMALTTGRPATICSNNADACGTASQWIDGALAFSDTNANKAINGTEAVRRRLEATPNLTITSDVAAITFRPDGSLILSASETAPLRLLFCDPTGRAEPRIIAVDAIGSHAIRKPDSCSL